MADKGVAAVTANQTLPETDVDDTKRRSQAYILIDGKAKKASVEEATQAVAAGTNVSVNAGDVVASAAGEAMINYGACRVRVAAGAAHTIGNAADVCAAVAASRPAGAAARWWPVVAFGLVGVAAAVGSSDDNEDEIPSSP